MLLPIGKPLRFPRKHDVIKLSEITWFYWRYFLVYTHTTHNVLVLQVPNVWSYSCFETPSISFTHLNMDKICLFVLEDKSRRLNITQREKGRSSIIALYWDTFFKWNIGYLCFSRMSLGRHSLLELGFIYTFPLRRNIFFATATFVTSRDQ